MRNYSFTVEKKHIDMFQHMNNAAYLEIYEQTRWATLAENNLQPAKLKELGIGPVILEINLKFLKEIKLDDAISIETQASRVSPKIFKVNQAMKKNADVCSTAEFTMAFFDLHARKIIEPTEEVLKLFGMNDL